MLNKTEASDLKSLVDNLVRREKEYVDAQARLLDAQYKYNTFIANLQLEKESAFLNKLTGIVVKLEDLAK